MATEEDASMKAFVIKLTFKQKEFKDKLKLKQLIYGKCSFKPAYIDLKKGHALVRFSTKLQADFCVKTLLDALWNEKKATAPAKASKSKQSTLSFGASVTKFSPSPASNDSFLSNIIESVDLLSS